MGRGEERCSAPRFSPSPFSLDEHRGSGNHGVGASGGGEEWTSAPAPQIMDSGCAKLHGSNMTLKRIAEVKASATKRLDETEASLQHMPPKRTTTMIYRGATVELVVATLSEDIELRIACLATWCAIDKGTLAPFLCENSLVPKNMVCSVPDVDAEVMKAARACRAHANKLLDQDAASDAEQLKVLLERAGRASSCSWTRHASSRLLGCSGSSARAARPASRRIPCVASRPPPTRAK